MNRCRVKQVGKLGACGMMGTVLSIVDMVKRATMMGLEPSIDQRTGMVLYRFEEQENVWNTFFQQPFNDDSIEGVELCMEFILNNMGMYPLSFDSMLGGPLFWPGNEIYFRDCSSFFKDTVKLSSMSNDYYAGIRNKYGPVLNGRYNCLYFRGTDKRKEVAEPQMEKYLEIYENSVSNINRSLPLVVQTDDQRFIDFVRSSYNDAFVVEDFRVSKNKRPLHVGHREDPKTRRRNGLEVIAVSQILANSRTLILNKSNVSTASCLFKGNLNKVFWVN